MKKYFNAVSCTLPLNKNEENGGGKDARAKQYLPPGGDAYWRNLNIIWIALQSTYKLLTRIRNNITDNKSKIQIRKQQNKKSKTSPNAPLPIMVRSSKSSTPILCL